MGVKADLGVLSHFGHHGSDAVRRVLEDHRTGRVHHVHALAAGIGHDSGLRGQDFRRLGVRHHEETHRLETERPGQAEMLDGDVGLGAVGGNPYDGQTEIGGSLDVCLGAQPGKEQGSDLGPSGRPNGRRHEQSFVSARKAVVERATAQAITVADLDNGHTGVVEGGDNGSDVVLGELVMDGVRAVSKRGVCHPDVEVVSVGHRERSPSSR